MSVAIRKVWLLLLLCACAVPQLYHGQLVALNLGMEPDVTVQKLGAPPLATYHAAVDGKDYLFHRYNLNNGVGLDTYFLAFEGNQLRYWGYIDDFRRHPDSRLNRAMDVVLAAMK